MEEQLYISNCPDCQHFITFANPATNLTQCPSCRSVIHRNEFGRLTSKSFFLVQEKNAVIQPGTTGTWRSTPFIVLGRFMAIGEESVYNYWTIQTERKEIALLAEAYGHYAMLKSVPAQTKITYQALNSLQDGKSVAFNPTLTCTLQTKYRYQKWEIEEELFIPIQHNEFLVADFITSTGEPHCLIIDKSDNLATYKVEVFSFEELQLKKTRDYAHPGKTLTCNKCSAKFEFRSFPYAFAWACKNCNSTFLVKNGTELKSYGKLESPESISIPIGEKGIIKGIEYEVVGYAVKEERNIYRSRWREYTLFNPAHGYAFLSEYDGHWIYLKEAPYFPVIIKSSDKEIQRNNEYFQLFNEYRYSVKIAAGEFPNNIFSENNVEVKEFISPPEICIRERDEKHGISWFLGEHIESNTLANAFATFVPRNRSGIGAIQPTGFINYYKLIVAALLGILLLLSIHTLTNMAFPEKEIFQGSYPFPDSSNQASFVTDTFTLDKKMGNLQLHISAPVNNSWFSLNATLVNTETGKEYTIENGVEFYTGYEGGEVWSEGSQNNDGYLTGIPKGNYRLLLIAQREETYNKINQFDLVVTYNVPATRNLVIAILLVMVWPVGKFIVVNMKEKERWSNSPFSNYD